MTTRTLALLLLALPPQDAPEAEWRTWRGPQGNGHAAEGPEPPTTWSETQNVVWSAPVPGRGHSSPAVVGGRVVLSTADESAQVQSVLAFDRASGKQVWKTDLHRGGFPAKIHAKNTHASPSVVSDGERLFATFFNSESVIVTALDLEGKKLWQTNAGPLKPRQYQHGYGATPAVYKSTVIVAADSDDAGGGFLAALDAKTGRPKWRTTRPVKSSFSSPVVAKLAGRDQLLLTGCDVVAAYDPNTGKPLWSAEATTSATAGTMVWSGDLVFGSGGWPKAGTYALRADGSAKVVWRNDQKCYEQSMLAHDGHLYAVTDSGVAFCWSAADGGEKWNARVSGKPSASPVLAGGNIYVSDEKGTTTVFRADPKEFKELARNRLGDESLATPSFCGGRIYARVARMSGGRREEFLYCIGKDAK
jgi:hypothetical protein